MAEAELVPLGIPYVGAVEYIGDTLTRFAITGGTQRNRFGVQRVYAFFTAPVKGNHDTIAGRRRLLVIGRADSKAGLAHG